MSFFSRGNFSTSDVLTLTGLLTVGALLVSGLSQFSGALKPTSTNLYDIGTATSSWREVYASSTVHAGGVTSTGNIDPFTNNTYDIGSGSLSWKDVYASGTSRLSSIQSTNSTSTYFAVTNVNSALTPLANNTYALGAYGSAWGNVFASGTARLGVIAVGGGTQASPAINFDGSTNSGIYSPAAQDVRIERAGTTDMAIFNANGIQFADHTFPGSNNLYNLGKFGSAWKGIYASSTSYFAGISAGHVTGTTLSATALPAAAAGATNPLCLDASGNGAIGASQICPLSSLASKINLRPISYGLDELLKTQFYDFELKQSDGRAHSGIVADYLKNTMPNLVMYENGQVNGYDVFSMVGVLGQSIKDLNAKVEAQQKEIGVLKRLLKK